MRTFGRARAMQWQLSQYPSRRRTEFDWQAAHSPYPEERPPAGRTGAFGFVDSLCNQVQAFLELRAGNELAEANVGSTSECNMSVDLISIRIESLWIIERRWIAPSHVNWEEDHRSLS